MEPVTHALTSLALGRAGLNRTTRLATPMLLAAGLAADLDWLSLAGGARAFFHGYRTATHSLVGTAAIAAVSAILFWRLGRKHPTAPVRFAPAVLVCAAGATAHLLLDLTNSYGVKLLWPFSGKWAAWDLLDPVDPWVLVLLLLGLLLPRLFGLVIEEIGARPKKRGVQRGAIVALVLLALYCGGRWVLHDRAVALLGSRLYHRATPLSTGAFPGGASPLTWAGVVECENTLEEIEVSLAPGSVFDPDLARTHFKPEPSPALEAARKSGLAREYLQFARFPKATVEKTTEGFHVELRDLRFTSPLRGRRAPIAVIELNSQAQVVHEELRLAPYREK
ncbi:MAG: metal-dependent hydrolase [Acidobacteria bacterium]|nr:metal-dependent hydrolase [Acidobacteriota bacterium]